MAFAKLVPASSASTAPASTVQLPSVEPNTSFWDAAMTFHRPSWECRAQRVVLGQFLTLLACYWYIYQDWSKSIAVPSSFRTHRGQPDCSEVRMVWCACLRGRSWFGAASCRRQAASRWTCSKAASLRTPSLSAKVLWSPPGHSKRASANSVPPSPPFWFSHRYFSS